MGGRVALVTGASSGIGRATARLLAAEGASLMLMALPDSGLVDTIQECHQAGQAVTGLEGDVANPVEVSRAFDVAIQEYGKVDAVFSNAGICIWKPLADTTDTEWQRLIAANLTGCFNVGRVAAVAMRSTGGSIVNTASELALMGEAGYVAYTATKGGILAMSKAMAAELWQYRIRVNALCPGGVNTPLVENLFDIADDPVAARRESEESVLLGRFGMAEEIAQAALYLLSDESSYVTGSTLVVDGGRTQCLLNGSTQPSESAARAGTATGV
jgi:NAD(P)-dependent dehydrogenase (short-subunit alcohol dehydrogenase family)